MEEKSKTLIVCIAVILIAAIGSVFIIFNSQTQTELIIENDSVEQGQNLVISLIDSNNNRLANQNINVIIKDDNIENSYAVTTNSNGQATVNINQNPGTYTVIADFEKSGYQGSKIKKELTVTSPTTSEIPSDSESTSSSSYPAKFTRNIGDYVIIQEGYNGFDGAVLVRDSQGRLWVGGGDGFREPSYFDEISADW